jgi:hypothetical protein
MPNSSQENCVGRPKGRPTGDSPDHVKDKNLIVTKLFPTEAEASVG